MLIENTFLLVLWSHANTSSCPLRERTSSLNLPPPLSCWSRKWAMEQVIIWGSWSRLYADWSYFSASSLIPCHYQFLSFKRKNFCTEASTSSWLLKQKASHGISHNPRELVQTICWLTEATFLLVLWSHTNTSSCPLRERTSSLKLPPPLGCWSRK